MKMMIMMDRTLLRVFYLSGWFIFSSGLYHEYHFVNTNLTWSQAQNYCRTTYTDLATIETITEINHVINTLSGSNSQVWIGLNARHDWRWTHDIWDKFVDLQNQNKNGPFLPYCLGRSFSTNGGWWIENCSLEYPFVCVNGTQEVYVNQSMDWFTAWRYCRENFTDLDSYGYVPWNASSWLYNAWVNNQNLNNLVPSNVRVWIGVVFYLQMFWSDGSNSSFRYWDNSTYTFDEVWKNQMRVAVDLQRSGKWRLLLHDTTLPFVCYNRVDMKSITVLKLRLSSSVDLNDLDVYENILKQLQDRLKEKGVSGVTLRWRKQPDGKIFHKEEKPAEVNDGC
ncbi:secretory phospholipase A2 receptor-like [Betta splendens]|uniref:Secretory phospholipase A2 receptor-like n=1 Tax=Betta splendens TaxID=158456 RepID=A0A9W2XIX1_BETSP|nr:secretory phospholipase A2 receptor-like [Betta splendens]